MYFETHVKYGFGFRWTIEWNNRGKMIDEIISGRFSILINGKRPNKQPVTCTKDATSKVM